MKIVIRAGGSGTRLWPLSRQGKPKQFLPLLGTRSLLEEKVLEVRPLVRHWEDMYVSVGAQFVRLVQQLIPKLPRKNIIAEPFGRNTGPAIALESAYIAAASRGKDDPVIASLTVDDVFRRAGAFRNTLRASEQFLHRYPEWSVVVAARPPQPDPGLSYIRLGKTVGRFRQQTFTRSATWVEKPSSPALTRLLKDKNVFAHTGLYLWKASTILSHIEHYQAKIFQKLSLLQRNIGTSGFPRLLRRVYQAFPSLSIEEMITRHVRHLAVAAGDFSWSDTGKWYLMKHLLGPGKQNVTRGTVVSVDDEDCLIYAGEGRVVGTVGLRGMIIVDTGDALLVCPKDRSGDVKHLIERLRQRKLDRSL